MHFFVFGLLLILLMLLSFFYIEFFKHKKTSPSSNNSANVSNFYNNTTDKFLAVYGEIIQAFRTQNVGDYLHYTAENMKLSEKKKALDAGCGVAGPASYFAENFPNLQISAISISEIQIGKAQEKIQEKKLEKQIQAEVLDYHKIAQHFSSQSFDLVYFLESFGHSSNKKELLHGVWEVLAPGGSVYIKDLFKREVESEWEQAYVDKICSDIDKAYEYNIGTLYETLSILRKKGFIIRYIKTPDVPLAEFEHLSISNEFQNLFNIGKIDSWDDYVFPIDFFEILAEKPTVISDADKHLYFMNLTEK